MGRRPVVGQRGELVCERPFPSMPLRFWNDPENRRYDDAYFNKFADVWCHGDFAEITERGGMIIHGRSDAVLNPGGVRIGTAEIYRQVEQIDGILDAVWDYDTTPLTRTVDMHVAKLRKKIEDDPSDPKHLITVHRVGYKFVG